MIKVSVNLLQEEVDALRETAKRHDITLTDAIRGSIILQRFLDEEIRQGNKILIEDRSQGLREIVFNWS